MKNEKRGRPKMLIFILIIIVFALIVPMTGLLSNDTSNNEESNKIDDIALYVDVNQFSRISSQNLIDIMGEPDSIDDWNNSTDRGKFLIKIYEYDGYAFFIADDSVVRMNIYSEKYYNSNGEGIEFSSEESIFNMLNIPVDYNKIKRTADTGSALRYSPVSDKVADVWCIGINKERSSIEEIKVTFNLNYF